MSPTTASTHAARTRALVVEPRAHFECHLLLWQHRGTSDLTLDGRARTLAAGHVCLVHADVTHSLTVGADAIVIPLFLRLGLPVETLPRGATARVDDAFHDLLLRLVQHHMGELLRTGRNVEFDVVTALATGRSDDRMPTLPRSPEAALVAQRITRCPESSAPIAAFLGDTFVSARTVARQFVHETGLSPQRWRTAYRLALAAGMIAGGTSPATVGPQVGYRDPAAFRRAFTKAYGVTPLLYGRRGTAPTRVSSRGDAADRDAGDRSADDTAVTTHG